MRIVLLGAPGSGKGTQAQRLIARFGLPQISTGDLLRAAVAKGTTYGVQAKAAMDNGQLVADDIVVGIIRERLAEPDVSRGYVLDGFPRNIAQAQALSAMLGEIGQPLDAVVQLEVPYGEIVKRIAGRRTCPACGAIYSIHDVAPGAVLRCTLSPDHPPLVQRPDDNEATVAKRLEVYEKQTRPLIEHYAAQRLLRTINANASPDVVTQRLIAALLRPTGKANARKAKAKARKRPSAARRKPPARRPVAGKSVARRRPMRTAVRRAAVKRSVAKRKVVKRSKATRSRGRARR
jgi:adenylate kinase